MDCVIDDAKSTAHRDRMRLIRFLIALTDDFESYRASLLYQTHLPTLEVVVSRLLFDETRLGLLKPPRDDTVLATTIKIYSRGGPKIYRTFNKSGHTLTEYSLTECHKCKKNGHVASHCPTKMDCRYYKLFGHSIEQCPTRPPRLTQTAKATIPIAAAATDVHTSTGNLETLLRQILSIPPSTFTALSTTPGNSP